MKVILFGGSGLLGKELQKLNENIIAPSHKNVDISDYVNCSRYSSIHKPDIIINAAAILDNRRIEKEPAEAIRTNIIGSANISIISREHNIRYVYISTDYVYKGDHGNYKEEDQILPFNKYAWTKLGGECSAVTVANHLIIRTSFGKNEFNYPEAFIDKWSSKDYIDRIAPMIYEAAISPITGILNIGTERKKLYDYAKERNEVTPVKISDTNYFTPYDTSLNLQKWINYKSEHSIAQPHTNCRVCGSNRLIKYLDLGIMPLANNLEFTSVKAKEKERFPLQVLFCEECGLSQLSLVIDPEKMFSYYTYRSSVNAGYVKHCDEMACQLKDRFNLTEYSFMVDIAGNDGTLLKQFKNRIGLNVLNVDPATNLVAIAEADGIESIADFWGYKLSGKILTTHGAADLITATNVFAHVDNVKEFILSAKNLLKPEGVLVLEFPYLVDFINGNEFDTVYFEHVSYFSIRPLTKLCEITNMKIVDVEKQSIHGGTVRVIIANRNSKIPAEDRVNEFIESEKEYANINRLKQWGDGVKKVISDFALKIFELKKAGNKIAAFAASAKGNTLLNSASMSTDIIDYIADETPEKISKFSPGTAIPIVNKQTIEKKIPDYIIILSWNFRDEIIEKLRKIYSGKFIIPIPEFEIIE